MRGPLRHAIAPREDEAADEGEPGVAAESSSHVYAAVLTSSKGASTVEDARLWTRHYASHQLSG